MPGDTSSLPLRGISVLDATHVIAGPYATYQLVLLGANVTRVERIGGDDFVRTHGGTPAMKAHGLGASFLSQNACKRSIGLNLKEADGREVFLQLAKQSDVVIQNFRPGVADRLGIGFSDISDRNSAVIYCSLSGYGPTGPLSGAPAYDHIVQGRCGMMAMTGTPESGPMRVGFPITDYIAGQSAVTAILAALLNRDRAGPDARPQHLNISMLDSMVGMMAAYAVDFETTGHLRGLHGNEAFSNSPFSGRFDTADGQIVVTANTGAQARSLCEAIGQPALKPLLDTLADDGFTTEQTAQIQKSVREAFLTASAQDWERRLTALNVPVAAIRSLAETLEDPQLREGGMMQVLPVPELQISVQVAGLPFQSTGWKRRDLTPAPTLGRDTDDVLEEIGFSAEQIGTFRARGVVA